MHYGQFCADLLVAWPCYSNTINLTDGLPPSFTVTILAGIALQGSLEAYVAGILAPPYVVTAESTNTVEVFEPSEGEGLFHHFIYSATNQVLLDIIARTADHDSDPDFIALIAGLQF